MNYYLDFAIIFILNSIYAFYTTMTSDMLLSMLAVISITCFMIYFEKKTFTAGLFVLYAILTILMVKPVIFAPVIIYVLLTLNSMVFTILTLLLIVVLLINQPFVMLCVLSLSLISGLISYKQRQYDLLKKEYLNYQDNSTLLSRRLKILNKSIIEEQNAEIYAATLTERNRIAREIHDNVGHVLSRSLILLGAVISINKDTQITEHLNLLKDNLNDAMTSIRESVHDLHDQSIDLKKTLDDLISKFSFCTVDFDYDMSDSISTNIKYCFISIVKEALSNVIKHSNADNVMIIIREHPGFYQLLISDNGTNFNDSHSNGIGLTNISDRVHTFNGTLTISHDKGFRIFISIPKEDTNK